MRNQFLVIALLRAAPNKQCSADPAPTWLVKQMGDVLAPVITDMINKSFEVGCFPSSQKEAIVRPRSRKSSLDPIHLTSFRPISNLSLISKLIERSAASRFTAHASLFQHLPVHQSAYRQFHFTETAVIIHNDIVRATDSGLVSALVLLDWSAAFDTVDHRILLDVLSFRFGVTDRAYEWFSSYLTGRTQVISTNTSTSESVALACGVPQGLSSAHSSSPPTPKTWKTLRYSHICVFAKFNVSNQISKDVYSQYKIGASRSDFSLTTIKPR